MDDDARSDMRRRQELQLVKAFLGISDPQKRQTILALVERLADEVTSCAPALAASDTQAADKARDI